MGWYHICADIPICWYWPLLIQPILPLPPILYRAYCDSLGQYYIISRGSIDNFYWLSIDQILHLIVRQGLFQWVSLQPVVSRLNQLSWIPADFMDDTADKLLILLPPASAVEVIETVLSVCVCVCVCVCPCVSALAAEPFDIWSQNLVQGMNLMISWMSLMVKVKGQRSRSPDPKSDSHDFLIWVSGYKTLPYRLTLWWHMTSQHDIMMSHDVTAWRHRMMSVRYAGGAATL